MFVSIYWLVISLLPSYARVLWKQEVFSSSAKTFLYIYSNYLQISIQIILVFLPIPCSARYTSIQIILVFSLCHLLLWRLKDYLYPLSEVSFTVKTGPMQGRIFQIYFEYKQKIDRPIWTLYWVMIIAFDLVRNFSLKSTFNTSLISFLFRFFKNRYVILLKKIRISLNM